MPTSAQVGVCKSAIVPLLCDGTPDPARDFRIYCGLTQVVRRPVLTDGLDLQDPGGIPGRNCVRLIVDPYIDYYDVALTTCSLWDPELESWIGPSDAMVNAAGDVYGNKARPQVGDEETCVCSCDDVAGCGRLYGLVTWSLNICPDGSPHPAGKFNVWVYPQIEFRDTTAEVTRNTSLNGRAYEGRSFENQNFGQGPYDILPVTEAPYDRAWYEFPTDICPPNGCDCGVCGEDPSNIVQAVNPLGAAGVPGAGAARRIVTGTGTPDSARQVQAPAGA